MDTQRIGPTGEPPLPDADPGDRGGLMAQLTADHGSRSIRIDFGTSLSWLSGTPEEMLAFADVLRALAAKMLAK